jgi:hypothetical protein
MDSYFKIDKIILTGQINGENVEINDNMFLEHSISVTSGKVTQKDGENITIVYDTLKRNMYNNDITPTIAYNLPKNFEIDNGPTLEEYHRLDPRPPKDNEYNALNDYNKKLELNADRHFNPLEEGDIEIIENQKFLEVEYKDINRDELSVVDVSDDFKMILHNYMHLNIWTDGTKTIDWGLDRYALKYGIIYPYNEHEDMDDVDVDISGLSDILK